LSLKYFFNKTNIIWSNEIGCFLLTNFRIILLKKENEMSDYQLKSVPVSGRDFDLKDRFEKAIYTTLNEEGQVVFSHMSEIGMPRLDLIAATATCDGHELVFGTAWLAYPADEQLQVRIRSSLPVEVACARYMPSHNSEGRRVIDVLEKRMGTSDEHIINSFGEGVKYLFREAYAKDASYLLRAKIDGDDEARLIAAYADSDGNVTVGFDVPVSEFQSWVDSALGPSFKF
jgi:hypothetical protein